MTPAVLVRVSQVFDSIAVRADGTAAWDEHVVTAWTIADGDTPVDPDFDIVTP